MTEKLLKKISNSNIILGLFMLFCQQLPGHVTQWLQMQMLFFDWLLLFLKSVSSRRFSIC